jgi:hypothetical protein
MANLVEDKAAGFRVWVPALRTAEHGLVPDAAAEPMGQPLETGLVHAPGGRLELVFPSPSFAEVGH